MKRLPFVPAVSRTAPKLIAMPMHKVEIGARTNCIVSYTARPAVTMPPGELMYRWMSFSWSWLSRYSSWEIRLLAESVVTAPPSPPTKMMRSCRRREKMS